ICRRLKQASPRVTNIIGGFGAIGEAGRELLQRFQYIDVAFDGEAERTIIPVLKSVLNDDYLPQLSAVSHRRSADGQLSLSSLCASNSSLDELPIPDFEDFIIQKQAFGVEGDTWLPFEASRGCWWGAKSPCSFCGLNGVDAKYRTK